VYSTIDLTTPIGEWDTCYIENTNLSVTRGTAHTARVAGVANSDNVHFFRAMAVRMR